jgi:hypothetical protein
MKKTLTSSRGLIISLLCSLMAFAFVTQVVAEDAKADGKWGWTMAGRNGGPDRKMTLKLKTEGEKLTGKLGAPTRDGEMRETEIQDGKIKGEDISFTVVREFNGNKMTSKYSGKLSGDSIKGKVEVERNGENQSRDWIAKRETDEKKEDKKEEKK